MMRRKVSALVVVIPTLLWSASPIRAESGPTDSTEPASTAAERRDSSEPAPAGSGAVETTNRRWPRLLRRNRAAAKA